MCGYENLSSLKTNHLCRHCYKLHFRNNYGRLKREYSVCIKFCGISKEFCQRFSSRAFFPGQNTFRILEHTSKCVWIGLSLNDLLVISIPPRGSCPPPVKTLSGWTVSFKTNQASQSIRRSKNLIKQAKKYSETWKHSFYNNCLMARVDL